MSLAQRTNLYKMSQTTLYISLSHIIKFQRSTRRYLTLFCFILDDGPSRKELIKVCMTATFNTFVPHRHAPKVSLL